jgi:hypothetical protein
MSNTCAISARAPYRRRVKQWECRFLLFAHTREQQMTVGRSKCWIDALHCNAGTTSWHSPNGLTERRRTDAMRGNFELHHLHASNLHRPQILKKPPHQHFDSIDRSSCRGASLRLLSYEISSRASARAFYPISARHVQAHVSFHHLKLQARPSPAP